MKLVSGVLAIKGVADKDGDDRCAHGPGTPFMIGTENGGRSMESSGGPEHSAPLVRSQTQN
jgi:hypothetical protein